MSDRNTQEKQTSLQHHLDEAFTQLKALEFAEYTFTLRFEQPAHLPLFKGSTIRGALLGIFKKMYCRCSAHEHAPCQKDERCWYAYLFESLPHTNTTFYQSERSHPCIIKAPDDCRKEFREGEQLSFGLLLLGEANQLFPYILNAAQKMGVQGIGAQRKRQHGRCKLVQVTCTTPTGVKQLYHTDEQPIPQTPFVWSAQELLQETKEGTCDVTLEFVTPLRFKLDDQPYMETRLPFPLLLKLINRRLARLLHDHHQQPGFTYDWKDIPSVQRVQTTLEILRWHEYARYSSRQQEKHPLQGLCGVIGYTDVPLQCLELLQLAERLHIGKSTVFGLGELRIERISNIRHKELSAPSLSYEPIHTTTLMSEQT